jgi:hypothetical protein
MRNSSTAPNKVRIPKTEVTPFITDINQIIIIALSARVNVHETATDTTIRLLQFVNDHLLKPPISCQTDVS